MTSYNFWRFWPLMLWPPMLYVFSPDIIVPWMASRGFSPIETGIILTPPAVFQMGYTYWCWSRFHNEIMSIQEVLDLRCRLQKERKLIDGLFVRPVLKVYHKVVDAHSFLVWLIHQWRWVIFFLAALPFIHGIRTAGTVFFAIKGDVRGLIFLFIANVIHLFAVSFAWGKIGEHFPRILDWIRIFT